MKTNARINVYVFHPFPFETLTLDAGNASAYEGTDQAAALVAAAIPVAKGAVLGQVDLALNADLLTKQSLEQLMESIGPKVQPQATPSAVIAKRIQEEITKLDDMLNDSRKTIRNYLDETTAIYQQVREVESAAPRPLDATGNQILRYPGVPAGTPVPWVEYPRWRAYMNAALLKQGNDTATVWGSLPVSCQKQDVPAPQGPWLPPGRICSNSDVTTEPSTTPFDSPAGFAAIYTDLASDLAKLPVDQPDPNTYAQIQQQKSALDERRRQLSEATSLLPALVAKYSTDIQSVFTSIAETPGQFDDPVFLGSIPGPRSIPLTPQESKILSTYKALGPTIPFTVNEQNQIANPLFALPAATQKQAIETITVLYASPRFEGSAGAFFSWLPNRTFSNITDTTVTGGVPAPADVRIDMVMTTPPLVIPFVGANYRISPEFTWPGGRRGALYGTVAVALNPYDSQVEYAAGLSLSWRYLMFSPLFHLGRAVHLTQGEQVGQLWCEYGGSATATSSPPVCAGGPPAPSTKMYWRGAFAFGISVRVPTTFASTNH